MTDNLIRIKSGIPGLDNMIEGGYPFPSTILVAGGTGTGKTTFSLQFLFEGARAGEQGLFFTTLSEPSQWMLRFASRWKFINKDFIGKEVKYVDLGSLIQETDDYKYLLEFIENEIAECMPQRVVIDPVTVICNILEKKYRYFLHELSSNLKNWQAVTLLTGEVTSLEPYPLQVAYSADGVILLYNLEVAEGRRRYLEVLKMRGTEHMTGKHLADISLSGYSTQPGLK